MKLRNKRTGDIWEFESISMKIEATTLEKLKARGCSGSCYAHSLAELNEDWEDYTPAEPLIKDEKIRKAVRAWAEALEIECCMYDKGINAFAVGTVMINFPGKLRPETLQNGEIYKIDELCGEEEE